MALIDLKICRVKISFIKEAIPQNMVQVPVRIDDDQRKVCDLSDGLVQATDAITSIEEQGFFLSNDDGHKDPERVGDVIKIGFEFGNRVRHKALHDTF
jgi:hypothetical protein